MLFKNGTKPIGKVAKANKVLSSISAGRSIEDLTEEEILLLEAKYGKDWMIRLGFK